MKNNIADLIANSMDEILNSAEHKALFGLSKKANKMEDENCGDDHDKDSCMAEDHEKPMDEACADDNDARKKKMKKEEDEKQDESKADDAHEIQSSAAFDVAIDSLLTASAALDSLGLGRGSAYTLKIASLVVEAKKKDKKDKKDKKTSKDYKKSDKSSAKSKDSKKDSKKSSDKKSK